MEVDPEIKADPVDCAAAQWSGVQLDYAGGPWSATCPKFITNVQQLIAPCWGPLPAGLPNNPQRGRPNFHGEHIMHKRRPANTEVKSTPPPLSTPSQHKKPKILCCVVLCCAVLGCVVYMD